MKPERDAIVDKLFAENIRREIEQSGKTKTAIALEIGISKPTLSQYMSGRAQPTLATLVKLCKCLDCSSDDLLGIKQSGYF